MAITRHQQPDEITPAYNEMIYVVSSNNIAQPNFKYVADVYIDSVYKKRLTLPAHPTHDNCVVDIHRVVESFIDYNLPSFASVIGCERVVDSFCEVVVKFGEEYGLDSSGVTVYPNLSNSSGVFAFAGSLTEFNFIDYVHTNYILNSSGSVFMTNVPRLKYTIETNQNLWIGGYSNDDNDVDRYVLVTYNSAGVLIDEYQITNDYDTAGANDDNKFLSYQVGYNVNNVGVGKFVTGTPPVLTSSVSYYDLYTVNSSDVKTSETIRIYIEDSCGWHDRYELHFQNAFGFFDSFVFTWKSTKNVNIQRKEYKRQTGTVGATSFVTTKADRGMQSYFTSSNEEITIRSRWLNESEYEWLRELIESPQVFWNNDSEWIAINVTTSSYEVKQLNNQNLIQLELGIKIAVNNYRQRY